MVCAKLRFPAMNASKFNQSTPQRVYHIMTLILQMTVRNYVKMNPRVITGTGLTITTDLTDLTGLTDLTDLTEKGTGITETTVHGRSRPKKMFATL